MSGAKLNFDTGNDDMLLCAALYLALADPGDEKLRCFCWMISGARELPANWVQNGQAARLPRVRVRRKN